MSIRNALCNCGSGKRFKHCCGSIEAKQDLLPDSKNLKPRYTKAGWFDKALRGEAMSRFCHQPVGASRHPNTAAPPGVLVVPNFLSAAVCSEWCEHFSSQNRQDLLTQNADVYKANNKVDFSPHESRITQAVDYRGKQDEIVAEVNRGFSECVMPFFKIQSAAFEHPSVLHYGPGGKYGAHSDSELWDNDQQAWLKTLNRDYSLLIYLNKEFEGGKLFLPNFLCKIKPDTGMLVAFPSDHRYLHEAEPLISGDKYAVVSWAAENKTVSD